jgi:hypothetical protein
MTTLTCDELRAMAAEVALGILSGAERADALDHLEHCVGCRVLVEGLAQTGDSLLLLAPEAEPSMGFESRVASLVTGAAGRREGAAAPGGRSEEADDDAPRQGAAPDVRTPADDAGDEGEVVRISAPVGPKPIRAKPSARRARTLRRRRTLVAVAAAVVFVGGTAATVTVIEQNGSGGRTQVADQTVLRSGKFQGGDGRPVGQVYTYSGDPSWVFMNVDASGANGTYTCELQLANGSTVPVGQFEVHDGVGEWAHTVGVDVSQIKVAKLVTPSGLTLATAKVS